MPNANGCPVRKALRDQTVCNETVEAATMMNYQTKVLRVVAALIRWGLFAEAASADSGVAYYLFSPLGEMKEVIVAAVIAWLAYPFLAEPS